MQLSTFCIQVVVIVGLVACTTASISGAWHRLTDPVENSESSVRYLLFTKNNTEESCILEPTPEALKRCPLNPEKETIILVHGYTVELLKKNLFFKMKDALLEIDQFNVIALDWDKFSGKPYTLAIHHAYKVAAKVAEMVNYLKENAGIKPENVCIIGHSLGAHLSGIAGSMIPNLGRIIGLDPAGPLFVIRRDKLSYKDATFVQVIHTSSLEQSGGDGLSQPMGHIDFYVNGGANQPGCIDGKQFTYPAGNTEDIDTFAERRSCNHDLIIEYVIESFDKTTGCQFKGSLCGSYADFLSGNCMPPKSVTAEMGFYAKKVPDLPPHSAFFLRTSDSSPYCLADGFLPASNDRIP